jgi:hypothetical protein
MIKPSLVLACALLAVPATAFAAQPATGTYSAYHKRISATASCAIQTGATWTSYFQYPGPLKNNATMRLQYDVPTGNPLLQISAYPTTPAAGAASWSGTEIETTVPPTVTKTITFTINFTYNDAKSWLWDRNITVGGCTAEDSVVLIRTGN